MEKKRGGAILIRLYFNKHGERPWSVDEGPGTPEQTFVGVSIHVGGRTMIDLTKLGSSNEPAAWIKFHGNVRCYGDGEFADIV